MKQRDKLLAAETRVKVIARLVAYNEIGEPIELVFVPVDDAYEWHVGGEYVRKASQQSVLNFVPEAIQNAF